MTRDDVKEILQSAKSATENLLRLLDDMDDEVREIEAACENLENTLLNNSNAKVIDVVKFVDKLKSENLYTSELERFLDDYFRFNGG